MADISLIKLPDNVTYTIKDSTARTSLADKADKADTILDTTLSRGRASGTTVGTASFAFGNYVTASGSGSHAEGSGTRATDSDAHAEGSGSAATASAAHAEGAGSTASGQMSHAEGAGSTASGTISHAEGSSTFAAGVDSHAEGNLTLATGSNSHAEGYYTAAAGDNSHAEGMNTAASGVSAHVEGAATGNSNAYNHIKVTGDANATTYTFTYPYSPYIEVKAGDYLKIVKNGTTFVSVTSVSGSSVTVSATLSSSKLTNYTVYVYKTRASGYAAHAEGAATIASGAFSHAEGQGTIASEANCHAEGQYNIAPVSGCIHIVGNGTADNARSNAHTLDMQGNAWYAGDVSVGTNNDYLLREKNLADRYDATSTYAVGDYCIYGGQLYKCTTAISTAEAWDSTHWTATDILSEGGGGGGNPISASIDGSKLTVDIGTSISRRTGTTLRENYTPNGNSWTDTASDVDFSDGGYIEVKVDLSTTTGNRENIISFGGEIDTWTTSGTTGHYHVYYTPGDNFMNCSANTGSSVHAPATVTPNSVVTIRLDKDGLWVEGVHITPKYTSRDYSSIHSSFRAINEAVQSYINSASSISVGSAEGSNRSHATYNYIKTGFYSIPVDTLQINDVLLDLATNTELTSLSSDVTSLDSNLNSKINTLQQGLAIVAQGNVHAAIAEGQYVYIRNHSTLSTGLYKASEAIAANAVLSASKLTAETTGALNSLLSQISSVSTNVVDVVYPVGSIYMSASSTSPSTLFPGTYWKRLKDQMLMAAGDTYSAGATGGAASASYTPAGTVGGHTLTTDEIPSHTHTFTGSSVTSGTESQGHTHSVGAHSHGLNSHKHSVGAHAHGLNSHTHTLASHTHTIGHSHGVYCSAATGNPLAISAGSSSLTFAVRLLKSGSTSITQASQSVGTSGMANLHTDQPSNANSGGSGTLTTAAATGNTANSTAFDSGAATGNTANSSAFDSGGVSANHTHNVTAAGSNANTGGGGSHDHGFTGTAATIDTLPPYLAVYMWMRVATANEAS